MNRRPALAMTVPNRAICALTHSLPGIAVGVQLAKRRASAVSV